MFINEDFEIKQRLVCVKLLKKSMSGEELARVLISTLSIESHSLVATMDLVALLSGGENTDRIHV